MKKVILATLFLACSILLDYSHAQLSGAKEAETNWTTKKKTFGDVVITATFVDPEDIWGPGYQTFYVQLDSDATNLDNFDFEKEVVLRDDNDWTYVPRTVKASGSGRHREAVLRFLKSRSKVEYLELVVKRFDAVFKWWSMISDGGHM